VSNFTFINPAAFLLFLLLPIAFWWLRKQGKTVKIQFSSLAAFEGKQTLKARLANWLPNLLRILAFSSLVIALARPQLVFQEQEIDAEGIDIVISIDLSLSMLSKDFEPDRLSASKLIAAEFVDSRKYDRIGITAFAGESYTKCPVTTDHRIVKQFLSELQFGDLQNGTAIGMGLATSVKALAKSKAKSKVIILLTDGENNYGYINPEMAVEMAKTFDIKVYTIGVSSEGEILEAYSLYGNGEVAYRRRMANFEESGLKEIASKTGGKYFRATDANSLKSIYNEIDQLEKTKMDILVVKRKVDKFYLFVLLAMIFISLEIVLKMTIFRTIV
jgi:Ca-activated chloride channel family protein